jgi:hypothetical protein
LIGAPVDVDLDVKLAADRASVAGLPNLTDPLPGPDAVAAMHDGRVQHVGVEVAATLTSGTDQQVVAVEDGVIARFAYPPGDRRDQFGPAGGQEVEAFVDAAATARGAEFADRAPFGVRPLDREDVLVVRHAAVVAHDLS